MLLFYLKNSERKPLSPLIMKKKIIKNNFLDMVARNAVHKTYKHKRGK